MDNQAGRIAMDIGHVCEELERFLASGAIAQNGWAFGAKSVNVTKLLFEGVAIEEEQGVEGLVLSGGRDARQSHLGKESFDFLFGRNQRFGLWSLEKGGVMPKPADVGFFGIERGVVECTSFSE